VIPWMNERMNEWINSIFECSFLNVQGGPGASGTGFGNFMEIGPLDVNLKPRNTTWVSTVFVIIFFHIKITFINLGSYVYLRSVCLGVTFIWVWVSEWVSVCVYVCVCVVVVVVASVLCLFTQSEIRRMCVYRCICSFVRNYMCVYACCVCILFAGMCISL